MRDINTIIIHCSFTKASMDIGVDEIRDWHVNERKFSDIGYHYVIRRDGTFETGRPIDMVGAHAKGHNRGSIGICMVGGMSEDGGNDDNFTTAQYKSLAHVLMFLIEGYDITKIIGHYAVSDKTCPNFNVDEFKNRVGIYV